MENGVERLTALVFLLTSLSHIAVPAAWARLFDNIKALGDRAGIANAAIHMPLGLIIVAFHNVWQWPGVVVTLIGWALLVKGSLQLLFPAMAQRSLALAGEGEVAVKRYRLAGILMLPLAIWIGWIAVG